MTTLRLHFFGDCQVRRTDQAVIWFPIRKELAILVRLASAPSGMQSRERLCGLLWPEEAADVARNNLRVTLSRLQKRLGESANGQPFLLSDRHSLQFNPASDHACDLLEFEQIMAEVNQHPHTTRAACPTCRSALQRATELYRGEFLDGFFVDECIEFEEWITVKRENIRQIVLTILTELSEVAEQRGELALARHYAQRLVELEPLREEAHRQLMRIQARSNERSAALTQFATLKQLLQRELDIEPEVQTVALYEQIRSNAGAKGQFGEQGQGVIIEHDSAAISMPKAPAHTNHVAAYATPKALPPHNLPQHLTPFSGREREVAELGARLAQSRYRLITVAGAGGMGKTRLALQVAQQQLIAFADGVFFVPFAGVQQASLAPATIATVLNLPLDVQKTTAYQQVLNGLRYKQMLLVLDNLEHLLVDPANQGAAQPSEPTIIDLLLDILHVAPGVVLLVTSRERLDLQSEDLFLLEGLPVPPKSSQAPTIAQAETFAGIQLFVERAQRLHKGFQLCAENLTAVIRICQLVEGAPLAIELAVTWLGRLSPADIVAELDQTIDLLTTTQRDVPAQHRSIRSVFETSWYLLTADEQQLFAQLSIFPGGFQRQAAITIVGAEVRMLAQLHYKSMLRSDALHRYSMHELLRQFAAEKLQLYPEATICEWRNRHCEHYLAFIAQQADALECDQSLQARNAIHTEIDHVRVAWQWAVEQGKVGALENAGEGLARYVGLVGAAQEGEQAFGRASQVIRGNVEQLPDGRQTLAQLLAFQADSIYNQSRMEEARLAAEEAYKLALHCNAATALARAGLRLGFIAIRQGNLADAKRYLNEVYQHTLPTKQTSAHVQVLYRLGWIAEIEGDTAQSLQLITAALQICTAQRFCFWEASILDTLAQIYQNQGNYVLAKQACTDALLIARTQNFQPIEGKLLATLATVWDRLGDFSQAAHCYLQALATARNQGERYNEASILGNLSVSADCCGQYEQALQYLQQSLQIIHELKLYEILHTNEMNMALQYHHLGDNERANLYARSALEHTQQIGDRQQEGYAWTIWGHALTGLGLCEEASHAYQQALLVQEAMGLHHLNPEPWAGLARIALTTQNLVQASTWVERILCFLESNRLDSAEEPARVYLTCYQVLVGLDDPRAATILQEAYASVQERASRIIDEQTRHCFLHNVMAHREIVQHYEQG